MSKCPKCELVIANVTAEPIKIEIGRTAWNGISYVCPHCSSVLSVGADPRALKADIVSELKREIQTWSGR
jgi:uncharacterized protein with PIN domain